LFHAEGRTDLRDEGKKSLFAILRGRPKIKKCNAVKRNFDSVLRIVQQHKYALQEQLSIFNVQTGRTCSKHCASIVESSISLNEEKLSVGKGGDKIRI
jgi:hypothetical protein